MKNAFIQMRLRISQSSAIIPFNQQSLCCCYYYYIFSAEDPCYIWDLFRQHYSLRSPQTLQQACQRPSFSNMFFAIISIDKDWLRKKASYIPAGTNILLLSQHSLLGRQTSLSYYLDYYYYFILYPYRWGCKKEGNGERNRWRCADWRRV